MSVSADGTQRASARSFAVESDGTLKVTSAGKTTAVGLDGQVKLSGLPKEDLPLKSAPPGKDAADLSNKATEAAIETPAEFRSSQAAGAESAGSAALMAKLAATYQWEQASPAERAQTIAAIEKAGITEDQQAELSGKIGKKVS